MSGAPLILTEEFERALTILGEGRNLFLTEDRQGTLELLSEDERRARHRGPRRC